MADIDPLDPLKKQLAAAWWEVAALNANPDGFTPNQLHEIASRARDALEAAWAALGLSKRELYNAGGPMGLACCPGNGSSLYPEE
jgi:hypothetical protein